MNGISRAHQRADGIERTAAGSARFIVLFRTSAFCSCLWYHSVQTVAARSRATEKQHREVGVNGQVYPINSVHMS